MRTLTVIKLVIILSFLIFPLSAEMPNTSEKNFIVFADGQPPVLEEQSLAAYMALINPFDRKAPLYAQIEALITSKNGKQKTMKYEMFTMRDSETVSVMINLSEPRGYKNTRMLITVPLEGGFPSVAIMMPFFLVPFRIAELSSPMDFFLMDITSEDMNSRNTTTDTYRIIKTAYEDTDKPLDAINQTVSAVKWTSDTMHNDDMGKITELVVEGIPNVESDYGRMMYFIDPENMLSMRTEFFDKKRSKVKVLEVLETSSPNGIMSATVLRMSDLKNGSNTLITYKELEYNVDVSQYITEQYLKTGSVE